MSCHTLGESFDIHAGGEELKFPHHENEIAQGEAHGGHYARYWMHNNLVQFEGQKISKSDPRMKDQDFRDQFQALRVVERFGAPAIRLLLLAGHYRRPVDFGPQAITAIRTSLGRMFTALGTLAEESGSPVLAEVLARSAPEAAAKARAAFAAAMDDDFNTGAALAQIHLLLAEARKLPDADKADKMTVLRLARDLGRLLGLFQPGDATAHARAEQAGPAVADDGTLQQVMALVLELRQTARANRDFATSDLIRDRLKAAGITVKDAKDGATWEQQRG
jgi:cysteinyl-tRNA synthetase